MEMFEVCHLCGSFAVGGFDTDYCVPTCEDCADPDDFYDDDGQPDEAQEWYDFDPDCWRKSLPCNDLGSAGRPRPT